MKQISSKQIEHLAKLSALQFSQPEKEKMKTDLEQILGFVDDMNKCNISKINYDEPEVTLLDLRDDIQKPSLSQSQALKNASETKAGYFVVPKVVD